MKLRIINIILCLIIMLLAILLINNSKYSNEDVNRDGQVNALDLAIVQRKIIDDNTKEEK